MPIVLAILLFSFSQSAFAIPMTPFKHAIEYYNNYKTRLCHSRYMAVIDFTQHSSRKRLYLIDTHNKNQATQYLVAHGMGSDPDHDGIVDKVSNAFGSRASSSGFYQTLGTYQGGNGYSLNLSGLSSTNSNALARRIVFHPADYVSPNMRPIGRSWGCPALENKYNASVINKLKNGSLVYIWAGRKDPPPEYRLPSCN